MAYNTGNPKGSQDPRDAADNKENFDRFAVSTERTYADRFGVSRKTIAGAMQDYAAYHYRGEWTASTAYNVNEVWRDGPAGAFYFVLDDYTSDVSSSAADIASGNVVVHQPKDWIVSVATFADLRNLEPAFDGQQVELLGHTIAGVGGGMFYADFSSSAADDNGVTAATPVGRRWVRKLGGDLTPEMFGAGINDDSQAILAAFVHANGKTVRIESKYAIKTSFDYSGPLDLKCSGDAEFLFFNDSQIRIGDTPVLMPSLSADIPVGTSSASFASSHNLASGDVFAIYNPTDFSWSPARSYYRDGCMFQVDDVTSATALKFYGVSPDSYSFNDFDVYKIPGKPVNISGSLRLTPDLSSTAVWLMQIDSCVNVYISGIFLAKGAAQTGLSIFRCFNVKIENIDGEIEGGDAYPVALSNSQKCTVDKLGTTSSRHCIGLGGFSEIASVPTRDVLISNSNLYNRASGGIGAADIHGNCENVRYVNCHLNSGVNPGGVNVMLSSCVITGRDVDSFPDGICSFASDTVGGYVIFNDCVFITAGTGGSFGCISFETETLTRDLTIQIKDCTVVSKGVLGSVLQITNALTPTNRVDVIVSGLSVKSSSAVNIVRFASTADMTGVSSVIIDELSAPAGTNFIVASNSVNYNIPARLQKQSGSQDITASSGVAYVLGVQQDFRYNYPRFPNATVSCASTTGLDVNGNRVVLGHCQRINPSYIRPAITTGDNVAWSATNSVRLMWSVSIDDL